ncbi:peptidylprolyl isomerase [Kriegella sp. EG-1]|nr:peptidylprolyl isomerase [Flavobacteriaceae bacterium EG-1]
MEKVSKYILLTLAILSTGLIAAQEVEDIVPETNTDVIDDMVVDSVAISTAEVKSEPSKRTKIDGISAVIGDYVILESDVEKALIDLKTQGVSMEDVTKCGLLGKLMEDRLYAHQAVQDSLLVSDDEVAAQSDRQLQGLVQQVGSMEKVLKFYRKEDEASLRQEIQKINKLQMLSGKMQQSIVEGIEITPEEVRQFFNKIPENERPVFGAEMEISQIVKQPKATEEEKQRTIDKLNAIKEDIEDNDASFNVKAILYSEGPSKSNGGLLGVITKDSGYDKDFKDVVFGLQEGEISEPFETQFGYHIAFVEKIRGQERDVRHIIMQPEISQESMDKAKAELDTIRKHIIEGKYSFAVAARNFSDEKETKFDGGLLRNPQDFSSRFELTKMDPTLYNQVRNLKDNDVSYPILENDPRGGASKYKLLQVTNRYDEHVADFSKDYMKIQQLAKTEKQYEAIKKWMDEHIEDTYISVNGSSRECEFENNWLKAE